MAKKNTGAHMNGALSGPMQSPFGGKATEVAPGSVMNHNPTPQFSKPRSTSTNPEKFFEGNHGAKPGPQLAMGPSMTLKGVGKG